MQFHAETDEKFNKLHKIIYYFIAVFLFNIIGLQRNSLM